MSRWELDFLSGSVLSVLSNFQVKQALRKFSEAARCKYLTNDDNKVTICHFEFIISEFEKKRQ